MADSPEAQSLKVHVLAGKLVPVYASLKTLAAALKHDEGKHAGAGDRAKMVEHLALDVGEIIDEAHEN